MKVNKMDLIQRITNESKDSQELSITDLKNIFESFSLDIREEKEEDDDDDKILNEIKSNSEEFFNMMSEVKFD